MKYFNPNWFYYRYVLKPLVGFHTYCNSREELPAPEWFSYVVYPSATYKCYWHKDEIIDN